MPRIIRATCLGRTLTVREWSWRSGVPRNIITNRLRIGWDPIKAIFQEHIPAERRRPPNPCATCGKAARGNAERCPACRVSAAPRRKHDSRRCNDCFRTVPMKLPRSQPCPRCGSTTWFDNPETSRHCLMP